MYNARLENTVRRCRGGSTLDQVSDSKISHELGVRVGQREKVRALFGILASYDDFPRSPTASATGLAYYPSLSGQSESGGHGCAAQRSLRLQLMRRDLATWIATKLRIASFTDNSGVPRLSHSVLTVLSFCSSDHGWETEPIYVIDIIDILYSAPFIPSRRSKVDT